MHNRRNRTNCTWRLTQDLRGVNAETKNIYAATLPTIDEIVSKCRNKVVTQLDINQAYFHIPLTDQSKEKTSFYLNEEMYEWNRMTQGLAGAPHTFMKFMYLKGIQGLCSFRNSKSIGHIELSTATKIDID